MSFPLLRRDLSRSDEPQTATRTRPPARVNQSAILPRGGFEFPSTCPTPTRPFHKCPSTSRCVIRCSELPSLFLIDAVERTVKLKAIRPSLLGKYLRMGSLFP